MIQNFCKELGFGSKGYSIISSNKKSRAILISGNNSNYKYLIEKIKRNLGKKPLHFKIDNKRFSLDYIDKANNKIDSDKMLEIIKTEPKQFQLVLYAIMELETRG